jgi:hypothetical protein
MFTSDFIGALQLTSKAQDRFLMIGRRWDTIITEAWDFNQPEWCEQLRSFALRTGKLNGPTWVDYFCFSRDLYRGKMPAFLVGRNGWDPWLVWFARNNHVPLVDASRAVVAVHQNHDYAYLKQGTAALRADEEAQYNWNLGKAPEWHFYATDAATERLVGGQLTPNPLAFLGPPRRRLVQGKPED